MTFSRNSVRIVMDEAIAEHASLKFTVWTPWFGIRVRIRFNQDIHTFVFIFSSLMTDEGPSCVYHE